MRERRQAGRLKGTLRVALHMRARVLSGAVTLAMVALAGVDAQSPQAQADATYGKLMSVIEAGETSKGTGRRTVFTQNEMNAYLQYRAQSWLPTGITNPRLDFVDVNKVATTVVADLDGVRRKSSGGWFDPTAYLRGKLPVHVVGLLVTQDGQGRFDLRAGHRRRHPGTAAVHRRAARVLHEHARTAGRRSPRPALRTAVGDRAHRRPPGQATVVQ